MSDGDRDTKPSKFDFASFLGPEPTWVTCPCGRQTISAPCFECTQAKVAAKDRDDRLNASLRTIPEWYRWALVDSPELAKRVKSKTLTGDIGRVLSSRNAVFAGPSGAGKTSLAIACLRARFDAGHMGMFVSALRLGTARIQSSAGQGEASLVERALAAPVLLIDEVGGEGKTATNAVRDVVFGRYDDARPTWITTGFKSDDLDRMYGDGFLRRLMEGACVVKLGEDGTR